jgi:hypothetical protein
MFAKVTLHYSLGPEIPSTDWSGHRAKGSKVPAEKTRKYESSLRALICVITPSHMITSSHQAERPVSGFFLASRFSTIPAAIAWRPMSRQAHKSDKRRDIDESFNPLHRNT